MGNINFLITNYLYADVNDQNWQMIKTYMKRVTGIDLSNSEIDIGNVYDTMKNLLAMKNTDDICDNPVFKTVNDFFVCNDDAIILSLNLIIYSLLKSYKTLQYENDNDSGEKKIEEEKNNDQDDDDEFDFNLIKEEDKKNSATKNEMKTYLLINNFFSIDFSNDKANNIFNYL